MAVNFILNRCDCKDNYRIYPYLSDLGNRTSAHKLLQPIQLPDVDVSQRSEVDSFKLQTVPGDFLTLAAKTEPESFQLVITRFSLGSEHNKLSTVEAIWKMLQKGGHWINLGNLDYPYEMSETEKSIEIPWGILNKVIIEEFSFKVVTDKCIMSDDHQYHRPSMEKSTP